ncbi:phosphoribosyltransferase-like protein [Pelagophyceae sp. CCMP2097]|nr:phosphoribosyltransferase-like protein [Pelagophyceae sp. CCMP2097]
MEYDRQTKRRGEKRYQIIAAPACEDLALSIEASSPDRFRFHPTQWGKFADGTDKIVVGGFSPHNLIAGEHVLMVASFHNNDVTLSQFQVMVMLLQSFVESLTIVLPYYPTGTMERVITEGEVATANTYAQLFSALPSCGRPTRLILYDLHTLQNRFYLHGNTIASLKTTVPRLLSALREEKGDRKIDAVAFPDDGAAKRFKHMFDSQDYEIIVCGKVRNGDLREISVQDGHPDGRHIIIVDDLVQTGGTLYECGVALKKLGAASVSAFVAHAVFPKDAYLRFSRGGDRDVFESFYVTDSIPTTTSKLPKNDVFKVIPIMPQILHDLDSF